MLRSLTKARNIFFKEHRDLLVNAVHERTIGAHFMAALEQCYPSYQVDSEYNKNLLDRKEAVYLGRKRRIYPDIVVHTRQRHTRNHLAIEIKPATGKPNEIRKDRFKLKALRRAPYSYPHTYLMFYSTGENAAIWFKEIR